MLIKVINSNRQVEGCSDISVTLNKTLYGITSYSGWIIYPDRNTAKIMEELIVDPINKELRDKNRINDCQHDFMENSFYQINLI